MNRHDFLALIQQENIMPHAFSLYEVKDESLVLDKDGYRWVVYYSERGVRVKEEGFASESDALEYMIGLLIKSHTSRQKPGGFS